MNVLFQLAWLDTCCLNYARFLVVSLMIPQKNVVDDGFRVEERIYFD